MRSIYKYSGGLLRVFHNSQRDAAFSMADQKCMTRGFNKTFTLFGNRLKSTLMCYIEAKKAVDLAC